MKIGFVGFGNMASAMADGWIAAGVAASDMCACAGHYDALVERCEARGMVACRDAAEVVAASDIVVAAVKPYMIEKVFAPLKETLADKVVLSVAWTWDSAKWEQVLPGVAHISTVPNTPVSVGEGVIACEKSSTLNGEQRAVVLDLLGKLGTVVELDTSLLFVGGTVGGCAPAFVAMAIEAWATRPSSTVSRAPMLSHCEPDGAGHGKATACDWPASCGDEGCRMLTRWRHHQGRRRARGRRHAQRSGQGHRRHPPVKPAI